MGKLGRPQEEIPVQSSPTTPTSSASSSHSTSNGGAAAAGTVPTAAPTPTTLRSLSRSDADPYPTTFVQAEASSFKQVVQMLTGSTETAARHHQSPAEAPHPKGPVSPMKTGPKRPAFKLYERRHHSFKNLKAIGPMLMPARGGATHGGLISSWKQQPEILSPSVLDFPSLALGSPVTPLSVLDPFSRPPHPNSAAGVLAEERAIAGKGFYLHPSPRSTPRDADDPPRLLPLFPVTSPRVSSGVGPSTAATF